MGIDNEDVGILCDTVWVRPKYKVGVHPVLWIDDVE